MKKALSLLGLTLGLVCLLLFLRAAALHWDAFRALTSSGRLIAYLSFATAVYATTYIVSARSWQLSLKAMDCSIGFFQSLWMLAISQIGKYAPGNVGQHIGRVVLGQRLGLPPSAMVAGIVLEAMLLVLAATLCSFAAIELFDVVISTHGASIRRSMLLGGLVFFLVVVLALLVPYSRRHIIFVVSRYVALVSPAGVRLSAGILSMQTASFVLGAGALWLTVQATLDSSEAASLSMLGIYSVAWLAGFLVPGAPAGLGVREALLMIGLTPLYGEAVATTSTALFRITTVSGDGLAFVAGLLSRKR